MQRAGRILVAERPSSIAGRSGEVSRAEGETTQESVVLRHRVPEPRGHPCNGQVVTESPRAQEVLRKIHAVAESDAPVLFTGETGTGKGMMAQVLYKHSRRSREPFLQVNCGALHEQLMESELFGHRKGSFSGASETKAGLFELADGGTLFLDEIGELPLPTQSKLLQVLDTKEFRPVGDTHVRRVNVRIVAATNRDLQSEAGDGRFRRDLFFRLNAVHIILPPLRERPEDIHPLLDHFLERHMSPRFGRSSFSNEALAYLESYPWPGNVRELGNVVESSVLLARNRVIEIEDLPIRTEPASPPVQSEAILKVGSGASAHGNLTAPAGASVPPVSLAEVERRHILHTLAYTRGQKAPAARLLGIDIKTLNRKIRGNAEMARADPKAGPVERKIQSVGLNEE